MSVHFRILSAVAVMIGAFLAGLSLQFLSDQAHREDLMRSLTEDRRAVVTSIVDNSSTSLTSYTDDYTYWDEMVAFVRQPTTDWAHLDVEPSLETFKLAAIWIYQPDLKLAFSAAHDRSASPPFPVAPQVLAQLASGLRKTRFFAQGPTGLLEVSGAPILGSDRSLKYERAEGWYFAAKAWDDDFIRYLSSATVGEAHLVDQPGPVPSDPDRVVTLLPLRGWDGRPVKFLAVTHTPTALADLRRASRRNLIIFACFGLLLLGAFYHSSRHWVMRPLRSLARSLETRNLGPVTGLLHGTGEFSELSRLMQKSFAQDAELRQAFAAFNEIDDAVFVINAGSHLIRFVNSGAIRLLGYSLAEFQQLRLQSLQVGSAQPFPDGRGRRPSPDPGGSDLSYVVLRTRSNQSIEVEMRRQRLPGFGEGDFYIVVARDITERRRRERDRQRSERLESLGALAGSIAHDLNNMLTPVTMFLEGLKEPRSRPSPELVDSVSTGVGRSAEMLRQLLTFGRGTTVERQPLPVEVLLSDVGQAVALSCPQSIEFRSMVPPDIWMIRGDAAQLHQMLQALCANAREAMPRGGHLQVTASNLQVTEQNAAQWVGAERGQHVLIEVTDTGTGIAPEYLDRIFEPFFTTKSHARNAGLGLSTALGIVRSHGGVIRVSSQPGQGTTVRIALPATPRPEAQAGENGRVALSGKDRTILIVEDEDIVRYVLQAMLRRNAFRVITAKDGQGGLEVLGTQGKDVSLVITDISMEGMDGITMLREIRRTNPSLPAVVMSGRVDNQMRTSLGELNVSAIVDKPFTQGEIINALRLAMGDPVEPAA